MTNLLECSRDRTADVPQGTRYTRDVLIFKNSYITIFKSWAIFTNQIAYVCWAVYCPISQSSFVYVLLYYPFKGSKEKNILLQSVSL